MMKILYFSGIIAWGAMAIVGLGVLNLGMIIVGSIISCFFGIYVWCVYPLIPFSSILLVKFIIYYHFNFTS